MENNILDSDFVKDEANQDFEYAGFWIRVGAAIVDTFVFIPIIVLSYYNLMSWKSYSIDILLASSMAFYKPYFEWKYQATLGKMAVGIKVVNNQFKQIDWNQSLIRHSIYFLGYAVTFLASHLLFQHPDFESTTGFLEVSVLQEEVSVTTYTYFTSGLLFISVIFVAIDNQKQALHDKIAHTFCIYK